MHLNTLAPFLFSFYTILLVSAQFPSTPSLQPLSSYPGCPPDGPLLPRPSNLAQSTPVQAAGKNLTASLDAALAGTIKAGWNIDNVSFSLVVVSPYGTGSDSRPIWEYHHRARNNTQGADAVTGDTQYLIGSVSKVFSALVLLKSGVDVQSRVTDFFPELKNSRIQWEEISLDALVEHGAGIPPNFVYEFYFLQPVHESLGFPHLNASQYPKCGVTGLHDSCSRQQILQGLQTMDPVVPVHSKPVYSQLSFLLFSLCLEQATGKNYTQLLHETVISPLNLSSTGVSPGDSNNAVIPEGMSSWGSDYGDNAPGGGLYSSPNDLSTLLAHILNHTILPHASDVRKWLKPSSMASSPGTLIGKPWEIQRTTHLTPAHPHTVDIYGKSGGAAGYVTQIGVIDQYGVGVVVMTAGPVDSVNILYPAVLGTFMPAIEEEARGQARKYTGEWSTTLTTTTTNTTPNSNPSTHANNPAQDEAESDRIQLTLTQDAKGGLNITRLTRNGTSITTALQSIFRTAYTALGFGILGAEFRAYPSELERAVPAEEVVALLTQAGADTGRRNGTNTRLVRQEWRVNLDVVPLDGAAVSDLPGQGSLDAYCASWQVVDWMRYGGEAMDKVVFVVDEQRDVLGVEIPALRGDLLVRS
ncbi:beta-lactamase/transpeptidase-like protein [Aspergillus steynii IBT 23096]|uniref:Beta-lactamase/transpeptidase-like protein n=1 Tax=Aspergillus steynii IBT 23096 TaxID=1392250 RepID=A0A2I2FX64_9EURO|nr:beta-lactamase/transpeptidase-like protein [Aspergillus steynii IBT 23096]PLB45207.1 beta-lactamase/transpeptidase-like protein [Aspergillus steynii IBT 23096]